MNSIESSVFYRPPSVTGSSKRTSRFMITSLMKETHQDKSSNVDPRKQSYGNHRTHSFTRREGRILSPPTLFQPSPTPDVRSNFDDTSSYASINIIEESKAFPFDSNFFPMTKKMNRERSIPGDLPRRSFDRRQLSRERRQRPVSPDLNPEEWQRLRQSLAELKNLATTEQIIIDPTTSLFNCDGYSFESLKQGLTHVDASKKPSTSYSQSRSGSSLYPSLHSNANNRIKKSQTTHFNSSMKRPSTSKPPTELFYRPIRETFVVCSKPLHSVGSSAIDTTKDKRKFDPNRSPSRNKARSRPDSSTSSSNNRHKLEKQRDQLLSDLSNPMENDSSSSPSPRLLPLDEEAKTDDQSSSIVAQAPTYSRAPSTVSLRSTIKLKGQIPRCRSALDCKSSSSISRVEPKFIVISDSEHRIESWYHHYPFIQSDELLEGFKSRKDKQTVLSYFVDESPPVSNGNHRVQTYLQGKPFYVQSDWNKFDIIFVSKNVFLDVNPHLQVVLNLLRPSGKTLAVYQVDHKLDLKTQIRSICRQFYQKI